MAIQTVRLRNVRCFDDKKLILDDPLVAIVGSNGSGKTTILEALIFAGLFKSPKTASPREMVLWGKEGFCIDLELAEQLPLHIGYAGTERRVTLGEKTISSYRDILSMYRIIHIAEDRLEIIQGYPEARRLFLDQLLVFQDPDFGTVARRYKSVLAQRNALLESRKTGQVFEEHLAHWTEQLQSLSQEIRHKRNALTVRLQQEVDELSEKFFKEDHSLTLQYPITTDDPRTFHDRERLRGQTLFGAHKDDLRITKEGREIRIFSSRGQQKMALMLLMAAGARTLAPQKPILLVDDFMTDFDEDRALKCLEILQMVAAQVIMTFPAENFLVKRAGLRVDL